MSVPAEAETNRRQLWSRSDPGSTLSVARHIADELKDKMGRSE